MPIERYSDGLDAIISVDEQILELANGFGGDAGPAEGPLWWEETGELLFSDIGNNRRLKWVPGQGISLVKEPTNFANGLTRDCQGRLLACEHGTRRVVREEVDGRLQIQWRPIVTLFIHVTFRVRHRHNSVVYTGRFPQRRKSDKL